MWFWKIRMFSRLLPCSLHAFRTVFFFLLPSIIYMLIWLSQLLSDFFFLFFFFCRGEFFSRSVQDLKCTCLISWSLEFLTSCSTFQKRTSSNRKKYLSKLYAFSTHTSTHWKAFKMSGKGAKGLSGKGLSGKGAKGTMSDKKGDKRKPTSRSVKAGLQFPVGRIHRFLKVWWFRTKAITISQSVSKKVFNV